MQQRAFFTNMQGPTFTRNLIFILDVHSSDVWCTNEQDITYSLSRSFIWLQTFPLSIFLEMKVCLVDICKYINSSSVKIKYMFWHNLILLWYRSIFLFSGQNYITLLLLLITHTFWCNIIRTLSIHQNPITIQGFISENIAYNMRLIFYCISIFVFPIIVQIKHLLRTLNKIFNILYH